MRAAEKRRMPSDVFEASRLLFFDFAKAHPDIIEKREPIEIYKMFSALPISEIVLPPTPWNRITWPTETDEEFVALKVKKVYRAYLEQCSVPSDERVTIQFLIDYYEGDGAPPPPRTERKEESEVGSSPSTRMRPLAIASRR